MAKLSEQFIWRTAIDMQRENNLEERGDTKTLKVRYVDFGIHLSNTIRPSICYRAHTCIIYNFRDKCKYSSMQL